ncbi:MAG: hypothetical protein RIT19_2234 [Verrucomicrobiota bacterium]
MKDLRIVVSALVIFAAGMLCGAIGVVLVGRLHAPAPAPEAVSDAPPSSAVSEASTGSNGLVALPSSRPPGNAQIEAMARWTRDLNLETTQRERIDAILKRATGRLRELWAPVAPRTRREIDAARYEIEQILTPEQRRQWNESRRRRANPKAPPPAGTPP